MQERKQVVECRERDAGKRNKSLNVSEGSQPITATAQNPASHGLSVEPMDPTSELDPANKSRDVGR